MIFSNPAGLSTSRSKRQSWRLLNVRNLKKSGKWCISHISISMALGCSTQTVDTSSLIVFCVSCSVNVQW